MILIYTFYAWNNKTFKFLRKFEHQDIKKIYINGSNGIYKVLKHIENTEYDYVIGLGDYGKDAKQFRIETKFINKYGKSTLSDSASEYLESSLKWTIEDDNNTVYIPDKTTIGPCNRSAYLITEHIKSKSLQTKLSFIHIPRGKTIEEISEVINTLISKLK